MTTDSKKLQNCMKRRSAPATCRAAPKNEPAVVFPTGSVVPSLAKSMLFSFVRP